MQFEVGISCRRRLQQGDLKRKILWVEGKTGSPEADPALWQGRVRGSEGVERGERRDLRLFGVWVWGRERWRNDFREMAVDEPGISLDVSPETQ